MIFPFVDANDVAMLRQSVEALEYPPLFVTVSGAHLYGFPSVDSDFDLRGAFVLPLHSVIGIEKPDETVTQSLEQLGRTIDLVAHDIGKFLRMMLNKNGYVLEQLYSPLVVLGGSDFEELQELGKGCITRNLYQPKQEEFGGWSTGNRYRFPDSDAERSYRAALKHWNEYQNWQRNRNPARAELERKFGYDTKHATHLFRLLRMGMEILETGQVRVYRPDREWLLAVRNGLLSYEAMITLAGDYETRLSELSAMSRLPEAPDADAVEEMVVGMYDRFLRKGGF
jgi:predicted nucleotidyltransferase